MCAKRLTKEERIKKLIARKRSLTRRKKKLPKELQKTLHYKKPAPKKAKPKKKAEPRKSMYDPLGEFLASKKEDKIVEMSFLEIEHILGKRLPLSARKYPAWWANVRKKKTGARHAEAWLNAGFLVDKVDLKKGVVTFKKPRGRRKGRSYPSIILEAAQALTQEGKEMFTRKDIMQKAMALYPRIHFKNTSFNPMIQAMIVGSNMSRMVREEWRDTLERVKRGTFRLSSKALSMPVLSPKQKRVKGKSLVSRVKSYLRVKESLPPLTEKAELPFQFESADGSLVVSILDIPELKPHTFIKLYAALFSLENHGAKDKRLIVREYKKGRTFLSKTIAAKLKPHLEKTGVSFFAYRFEEVPEKDSLVPLA